MARYEFYSQGKLRSLSVEPIDVTCAHVRAATVSVATKGPAKRGLAAGGSRPRQKESGAPKPLKASAGASSRDLKETVAAVHAQNQRLGPLFQSTREQDMGVVAPKPNEPIILVTDTVVIDGARKSDITWLRDKFGLELLREGLQGKVLLKSPTGGNEGRKLVFDAAKAAFERGHVTAAHPNFVRMLPMVKPSAAANQPLWNHDNTGNPGLAGSDVAAKAAWIITRGRPEIRVAVIDEGVDSDHPALKAAIVAEKDFVDANPHARPDGDDAHGTACAGIVVSRDGTYAGLAPACSLVAVRIAKGDGKGSWIFDDFDTADAIDWAWDDGKADVLSNSWGGGPAVDVITLAIDRARTRGRKGKGAVVVFAAGNADGPVQFPGSLEQVITVGASNQWDERKSPKSKDGETGWGSNFGKPLDLIAPGVRIATTDIQGAAGYSPGDFTLTFNGTSAATPHVAAAAALILALMPGLNEGAVSAILNASTDRLTKSGGWDKYVGFGRLNIFSALRLARRWAP
ncbi:MAG: S8 family serine peptidase [Isosphaerales bacterium]